MEDFTVLDQTTQNMSASNYRGKLGFAERDDAALSKASVLVVQTLEEFGHEVDRFHAKRAHRVNLDCDHYIVSLRHRRSPAPMRQSDGAPCRSHLDITFTPRFPEQTDQELTEMLLARSMQALLTELNATTVEWLETGVMLDRAAFLSAFGSSYAEGPSSARDTVAQDIQVPVDAAGAVPVDAAAPEQAELAATIKAFDSYAARSGGAQVETITRVPAKTPRFASVEDTFGTLTTECDRVIERRAGKKPSEILSAYRKVTGVVSLGGCNAGTMSAWVLTAIMAMLSLPLGITAAAVNLARGGDMRFSVQMLGVLALLMFLQSSGLVYAALL